MLAQLFENMVLNKHGLILTRMRPVLALPLLLQQLQLRLLLGPRLSTH